MPNTFAMQVLDPPAPVIPRQTLSLTGSPWTYQNTTSRAQLVTFTGGTVSTISTSSDNATFDVLGLLQNQVTLAPGMYVKLTYITPPTVAVYTI